MTEAIDKDRLTPREQLKQELLFHANNAANRALNSAAKATANALSGDEEAARVYQQLADMNSNDALQAAYEAGEVVATNEVKKDPEDPIYDICMRSAGKSIDIALWNV